MAGTVVELAAEDLDRLIGIPEAAARLDIHPVTAREWVREGRFPVPVINVGGTRKVSLRRLVEFVNGPS